METEMTQPTPREYSYREFCDFARRFSQVDLLAAIARTALALPSKALDKRFRDTPLWCLAALVKASICHGNAFRTAKPRDRDIRLGCYMYNNLESEDLDQPDLNSGFGLMVRIAYEQLPPQMSNFGEITRLDAFFNGYSGRKQLEVITAETLPELLGAPLMQAVGVAMLLYGSAHANAGIFDPRWMDRPDFAEILRIVSRDDVLSVIDTVFVNTFEEYRAQAEIMPQLPFLERYRVNPLTARPLIRLPDERLIAPIPQLILWKLSPLELYYQGIKRWKEPFTRDMGELLEDYVGRQFDALADAEVWPEVVYKVGKNEVKSVDWIIVFTNLVLLVEVKATRVPAPARAGDPTLDNTYIRTLGKAFTQIDRTSRAIADGMPEFAKVPTDRPMLGIVATLDPWYMANSFGRALLPEPEVPTMVASVREIEALVAIGQRRSASTILIEVTAKDDERRFWELETALGSYSLPGDRNPLLQDAWQRYPFGHQAQANRAAQGTS